MQDLASKTHNFFNETIIELKNVKAEQTNSQRQKGVGLVEKGQIRWQIRATDKIEGKYYYNCLMGKREI